jgi:hypothetical protein
MKTRNIVIGAFLVFGALLAYTALTGGNNASNKAIPSGTKTSTAAQDTGAIQLILPVTSGNPITNNATAPGFAIASAIVENNTDPITKIITSDHLEVTLKNVASKDIAQFETYYSVKDLVTHVSDAYYTKLTGFVLKAGETRTFHFDNTGKVDHYRENNYSVYRTSKNAMQFDITVSAPSYKVQNISIRKDKGGAEKVD